MPFKAPLQVLIAGEHGERDRKLTVLNAERFAIVGQSAQMVLRVDDFGGGGGRQRRSQHLSVDGKPLGTRVVPVGQDTSLTVPVTHEGENIVELSAAPGPSELTLQNNRAVVTISGVRDRLRVLLISGEPHAGERVWRNLLKADPSVDLVHFTILRPPDKQDATPIEELSLIAFPDPRIVPGEAEILRPGDLRPLWRGRASCPWPISRISPIMSRMAARCWCRRGRNSPRTESLYRTPLASVLPAQPTGEIVTQAFKPHVTADWAWPIR